MSMAKNKIARGFVWIIMALVLVGLIGFGSFNFGGTVNTIGTVGETEIGADAYFRELNSEINAFEAATGQKLTMAQVQALGIDQQVLDKVISGAALDNETARLGISVGDAEVARRVKDIAAFQGVDGAFDRDTYDFVIKQSGLTASEFEASLRRDVSRTILQTAVTAGVSVQPVYVDTLYAWARETRDFTWAKVDATALEAPVGEPDDAALAAFYEANPARFTLPETRKITYAWLAPEDVLDDIEVPEADLRALYDSRIDEFVIPERRLVERLVFGTEAEAAAAAARIAEGTSRFEDEVAARDLALADTDMGDVTEIELGSAGPQVFAADAPGIAGPVMSDLGPALFRINATLAGEETSFEEAHDGLKAEYAADAARRAVSDRMGAMDDLLAGGATLEDLASEQGLRTAQIDWTPALQDGIAAYDAFREAAAALTEDDYPEMLQLSDGGVFGLRLDAVEAPRLQPLDEVRATAIAGWQAEETVRRVLARAEEMIRQFEAGESPSSLGLTEVVESGQSREAFVEGTPPALMATVFEMDLEVWKVIEDADGAVLVRLDAVTPADPDSDDALAVKGAFSQRSAQEIALDLEAAFSGALEAEAGITINRAMVNAVNANFP